jgi:hypothetical protein
MLTACWVAACDFLAFALLIATAVILFSVFMDEND